MVAKVTTEEASRRRRLINHSLRGLLSNEQVKRSVQVWEEEFCESSVFVIASFVRRLEEEFSLSASAKKNVYAALSQNMFLKTEQLGEDPHGSKQAKGGARVPPVNKKVAGAAATAQSSAQGSGSPPYLVVLNAMLQAIVHRLQGSQEMEISSLLTDLIQELPSMGLGAKESNEFRSWCRNLAEGQITAIKNAYSAQGPALFVHAIYVWVCNAIGPSATDKIFAQIVREVETLPESDKFSPRQFL